MWSNLRLILAIFIVTIFIIIILYVPTNNINNRLIDNFNNLKKENNIVIYNKPVKISKNKCRNINWYQGMGENTPDIKNGK